MDSCEYKISDGPVPSITLKVQPEQAVMASSGAFLSGSPAIAHETEYYRSKSSNRFSFLLSGESLFLNRYTNKGQEPTDLVLSDEEIGVVVEIKDELKDGILCVRGAFIAATSDIDVGFKKVRDFSQAALTGQSLWMQSCKNKNTDDIATVFLMAATQPIKVELKPGEMRLIDNKALFAMTEAMPLHLYENEGLTRALGSGEGRFMTVVEGPGTLWIAPQRKTSSTMLKQISRYIMPG